MGWISVVKSIGRAATTETSNRLVFPTAARAARVNTSTPAQAGKRNEIELRACVDCINKTETGSRLTHARPYDSPNSNKRPTEARRVIF